MDDQAVSFTQRRQAPQRRKEHLGFAMLCGFA